MFLNQDTADLNSEKIRSMLDDRPFRRQHEFSATVAFVVSGSRNNGLSPRDRVLRCVQPFRSRHTSVYHGMVECAPDARVYGTLIRDFEHIELPAKLLDYFF